MAIFKSPAKVSVSLTVQEDSTIQSDVIPILTFWMYLLQDRQAKPP